MLRLIPANPNAIGAPDALIKINKYGWRHVCRNAKVIYALVTPLKVKKSKLVAYTRKWHSVTARPRLSF